MNTYVNKIDFRVNFHNFPKYFILCTHKMKYFVKLIALGSSKSTANQVIPLIRQLNQNNCFFSLVTKDK